MRIETHGTTHRIRDKLKRVKRQLVQKTLSLTLYLIHCLAVSSKPRIFLIIIIMFALISIVLLCSINN